MKKSSSPRPGRGVVCALGNVDSEIDHLERVLAGEGVDSLFGRTYWRSRVIEVQETPGLVPRQRERLKRLLSRFTDGPDNSG
ncbi:hypothetical protein [Caballeronia catudaia]|uniref:hypothetical protein n=1 Tax=Caballeronia catudaia TaxID=1777136 RepID=UPI000AEC5915|nr:hypothetical protein [Caballeronia catudaia]